jgi:hypothetical protein
MTKLQPPVGTRIETREEAIRVLLSPEYLEFSYWNIEERHIIQDCDGGRIHQSELFIGNSFPWQVISIAEGFTEDPNYTKTKLVEVPVDALTDRWLDAGDFLSKVLPQDYEQFLLLLDDEETTVQCEGLFCAGATEVESWEHETKLGTETFEPDEVVAIKPISWVLDFKSPESQADAKRFAGVKTWEPS